MLGRWQSRTSPAEIPAVQSAAPFSPSSPDVELGVSGLRFGSAARLFGSTIPPKTATLTQTTVTISSSSQPGSSRVNNRLSLNICQFFHRLPLALYFCLALGFLFIVFWVLHCVYIEDATLSSLRSVATQTHRMALLEAQRALSRLLASAQDDHQKLQNLFSMNASVQLVLRLLKSTANGVDGPEMIFVDGYENASLLALCEQEGNDPKLFLGDSVPSITHTTSSLSLIDPNTAQKLDNGTFEFRFADVFSSSLSSCINPTTQTEGVCVGSTNGQTRVWLYYSFDHIFNGITAPFQLITPTPTSILLLSSKSSDNRILRTSKPISSAELKMLLTSATTPHNKNQGELHALTAASGWTDCVLASLRSAQFPISDIFSNAQGWDWQLLVVFFPPEQIQATRNLRCISVGVGVGCLVALCLMTTLLLRVFVTLPFRRFKSGLDIFREAFARQEAVPEFEGSYGCLLGFTPLWESLIELAKSAQVILAQPRNYRRNTMQTEDTNSVNQSEDEATQMMRAKDMFFATMSHEMRTPLTAVIGMAEVLLGTPLTERQKECVDAILVGGYSMQQLVNDILDFSKLQAEKLDLESIPFNVRECVEHSAQVVQLKADEKGLELIVVVKSDVPSQAVGDPSRLRQVLFNLLSNAVKFTSKGYIAIRCRVQSGRLHFEVQDTGIGISTETMGKLFKPFVQADSSTSRKFGGSGLGLVIAQQIVHMMDGNLEGHSEGIGKGSTFAFSIPLISPGEESSLKRQSTILSRSLTHSYSPRSFRQITPDAAPVLSQRLLLKVVDKNQMRMDGTCELLRSLDFRVLTYADIGEVNGTRVTPTFFSADMTEVIVVHLADLPAPQQETIRSLRGTASYRAVLLITTVKNVLPDSVSEGLLCVTKPLTSQKIRQSLSKLLGPDQVSQIGTPVIRSSQPGTPALCGWPVQAQAPPTPRSDGGPIGVSISIATEIRPFQLAVFATMKVLVVDDVILNQRVITLKLQQAGFTHIDTVSSGNEALSRIRSEPFVYDIILMDISMPELNGYETTRAIKLDSRYECVPIIGVTGNCMPEDIEEGLASGMLAVLCKPINTDELLGLLEDLAATAGEAQSPGCVDETDDDSPRPALRPAASSARLIDHPSTPPLGPTPRKSFSLPRRSVDSRRSNSSGTGPVLRSNETHPFAIYSPGSNPKDKDPPLTPLVLP